jgi:hypothetical protein
MVPRWRKVRLLLAPFDGSGLRRSAKHMSSAVMREAMRAYRVPG